MSEIHAAVGSYVVHALDGPERAEFEAHLVGCASCRREVLELSEAAAQLTTLTEAPPPPALRSAILSAITEVRPLPPADPEHEGEHLPRRALAVPDEPADAAPDELALRRQRRATRLLAFAVAAALVVALAMGGWVVNLVQDRRALVAESALETQLQTAPDAKIYTEKMVNGAPVSFVVSKSLNQALFIAHNLPDPGTGKTYQLWTLETRGEKPNRVFSGGTIRKTWFDGGITTASGVAVTIEPAGGSSSPTTDPLVVRTF